MYNKGIDTSTFVVAPIRTMVVVRYVVVRYPPRHNSNTRFQNRSVNGNWDTDERSFGYETSIGQYSHDYRFDDLSNIVPESNAYYFFDRSMKCRLRCIWWINRIWLSSNNALQNIYVTRTLPNLNSQSKLQTTDCMIRRFVFLHQIPTTLFSPFPITFCRNSQHVTRDSNRSYQVHLFYFVTRQSML